MNILVAGLEYNICKLLRNFSKGDHRLYIATSVHLAVRFLLEEKIDVAFFNPTAHLGEYLAILANKKEIPIMSCEKLNQGFTTCVRKYGKITCENSICSTVRSAGQGHKSMRAS